MMTIKKINHGEDTEEKQTWHEECSAEAGVKTDGLNGPGLMRGWLQLRPNRMGNRCR